jgi:hypothetical protein
MQQPILNSRQRARTRFELSLTSNKKKSSGKYQTANYTHETDDIQDPDFVQAQNVTGFKLFKGVR